MIGVVDHWEKEREREMNNGRRGETNKDTIEFTWTCNSLLNWPRFLVRYHDTFVLRKVNVESLLYILYNAIYNHVYNSRESFRDIFVPIYLFLILKKRFVTPIRSIIIPD